MILFQLLNLGRLLRVGGNSSKEMHGQVMRLVAQAAIKASLFYALFNELDHNSNLNSMFLSWLMDTILMNM